MEYEGEDHPVHGKEQPDVDHFEVGSSRQGHLNAGTDGCNDQHEGQAHHHPVREFKFDIPSEHVQVR